MSDTELAQSIDDKSPIESFYDVMRRLSINVFVYYPYMCLCTIYICVYVLSIYICVHVLIYICVCVLIYICACVLIYICVCVLSIYVFVYYIYMCVCYIDKYTNTYIDKYINTYIDSTQTHIWIVHKHIYR
jgi:hypothetical protein